jgi:UDP-2,4-diacetamido-2,4,6-trideoxy-beta-L-altropyranose hydrolase
MVEPVKRKIIFRVDGGANIGMGHISRCCALADMLKDSFKIHFYTRANTEAIIENIKNYSDNVFTLSDAISYTEESSQWISVLDGNETVVLDGYNFDTNYQQQVKAKGSKLVCIDDIHAYPFVADAVINHAPGIKKERYSAEPYTRFYLGTDYVLLKKIFLQAALEQYKLVDVEGSSVLICFGGADPNNVTKEVLEEIMRLLPDKKINVVVGTSYTHLQELKEITETSWYISLHINVEPQQMLELMQQSNIAITSASTIALEYICVKGNLFLKCIADNQRQIYTSLIQNQCAYAFENLKESFCLNQNILQQKKLIDGKSDERLLNIFRSLDN